MQADRSTRVVVSPQVVVADLANLRCARPTPGCACDEGEVMRVAALTAPLAYALHKVVANGSGATPGDHAATDAGAGNSSGWGEISTSRW